MGYRFNKVNIKLDREIKLYNKSCYYDMFNEEDCELVWDDLRCFGLEVFLTYGDICYIRLNRKSITIGYCGSGLEVVDNVSDTLYKHIWGGRNMVIYKERSFN